MFVNPYLFFDGRCEEAINFYRQAIGAELVRMMRYSESPDKTPEGMLAPGSENKVMHAEFRLGDSLIMASDGSCHGNPKFDGVSLTLSVGSENEAERAFAALGDGGQVQMPLMKTFFSPKFGMVADKFGVSWMVIVPQPM
jgi:PhnB protein